MVSTNPHGARGKAPYPHGAGKAPAPASLSSTGNSPSWKNYRQSAEFSFSKSSTSNPAHTDLYGAGWRNLGADVLCEREVWEQYTYFVVHDYAKKSSSGGDVLKSSVG